MPSLRIGELSRRTGVSPELLRAWERRYGLLRPARTDGGFRVYSDDDERRIRRMQEHLAHGVSAGEAARLAVTDAEEPALPVQELLEAHIFNFDRDLYGQKIEVALHAYIREEKKFEDVQALVSHMKEDEAQARHLLALD